MWSSKIFIIFVFGICSSIELDIEIGTGSRYDWHGFQPLNEKSFETVSNFDSTIRKINEEDVPLMLDKVKNEVISRVCTKGCGPMGFCFERLCYRFPFEKYQISHGSLVKNQLGMLESCNDKCNGEGLYCRKGIFETGICLTADPICKFNLNYTTLNCSKSNECLKKIDDDCQFHFFEARQDSVQCVLSDISGKNCCNVDPQSFKCPDNMTPVLFQSNCQSNCTGLCFQDFCCPNVVKAHIHYGASPSPTNIPCDPRGYPKEFIRLSGCFNGTVVRFGREDVNIRETGRSCKILPNGEFYNGCGYEEMCMLMKPEKFICVKSSLQRSEKNEISYWFLVGGWFNVLTFSMMCIVMFGLSTCFSFTIYQTIVEEEYEE